MDRVFAAAGAVSAFLAVALGAFGAHALRSRLSAADLSIFETGVRYQMYHALALLFVAWAVARGVGWAGLSGGFFIAGTVVFSGSLYALVLTGQRWLGAVTPVGGVCFLVGWALLAIGFLRS